MPTEHLADLDELVLRCKGAAPRQYIAEAVACYKAGAYRACIVATWIAVVYDIIGKLRDLDLAGDKNAHTKLEQFERVRSANDLTQSLNFERQILDMARDEFELITPLEHIDLARLQEDRNRCAHPSMNSLDEIYRPSAELARQHLRNAIVHLLQHPPVQGKAALQRLQSEVGSLYFPDTTEQAIEHFSSGPLARPRKTLVSNFIVILVKSLLLDDPDDYFPEKREAALNATRRMHRESAEKALADNLGPIMRRIPDANLHTAVAFLSRIPDTWQFVPYDIQGKLKRFIEHAANQDAARSIHYALDVEGLRPTAEEALAHVSPVDLAALVKMAPRREYVDRAVDLFTSSQDSNVATSRAYMIITPLITYLESRHLDTIMEVMNSKTQIEEGVRFSPIIASLLSAGKISQEQYDDLVPQL